MSYRSVMQRVEAAATRAQREASEVTVVAVSKTQDVDAIMAVYDLGHRDFGENRAKELAAKAPLLPHDIRWHFVGPLQSNKTRLIRSSTSLLHSMDRESLANAWLKGHGQPPPVMVQVNVDGEAQKSGVSPDGCHELTERLKYVGVEVRGLMAIPRVPVTPEDNRAAFAGLRQIRDEISMIHPEVRELSMGMTDDFEVAVEEGASFIRLGRAIFGDRKPTGD